MILDGVIIECDCLITAGALCPPDKRISKGSTAMSIPGIVASFVTEH